ncbi:MAG: hypothetical protein SFW62_03655 [Alphaproteobacteria bacterium]|nr:hypothetical protein [Alphaproteobacteria bacterium]
MVNAQRVNFLPPWRVFSSIPGCPRFIFPRVITHTQGDLVMSVKSKIAQFIAAGAALVATTIGGVRDANAQTSPAFPIPIPTYDFGPTGEDGCPVTTPPAEVLVVGYYVKQPQPDGIGPRKRLIHVAYEMNNLTACANALVVEMNGGYNVGIAACINGSTHQYDLIAGVSKARRDFRPKPSLLAATPFTPPGLAPCGGGASTRRCQRLVAVNPTPPELPPATIPTPAPGDCPTVPASSPYVLVSQGYEWGPGVLQTQKPANSLAECAQIMCDDLNAVIDGRKFLSKNCLNTDTGNAYEVVALNSAGRRSGKGRDAAVLYSDAATLQNDFGCPPCVAKNSRKCQNSPLTP